MITDYFLCSRLPNITTTVETDSKHINIKAINFYEKGNYLCSYIYQKFDGIN